MRLAIPLIVISLFTLGCYKSKCESWQYVSIDYRGFDSVDVSQVIVSKYEKGTNFGILIESDTASLSKRLYYNSVSDYRSLNRNYDWVLSLPVCGKIYQIKELTENKEHRTYFIGGRGGGTGEVCTNSCSYNMNGKDKKTGQGGYEGLSISIHKYIDL
jgi:hypothetical protein